MFLRDRTDRERSEYARALTPTPVALRIRVPDQRRFVRASGWRDPPEDSRTRPKILERTIVGVKVSRTMFIGVKFA